MAELSILVTGAYGFLGEAILSELLHAQISAWGTDRRPYSGEDDFAYREADITRAGEVLGALKGADVVIHTAGLAHVFVQHAEAAERFHEVNATGTENVARASIEVGIQHFILISSVAVYGPDTVGVYGEATPCAPIGPYAESKYAAEMLAIEAARESGMALTILRLATLYGEGDPGNINRLIRSIDRGRFVWIGDGKNRKSLLYKGDAARACKIVAMSPASGIRIFNVSGPPRTMRDIVDVLTGALGKRTVPGRIPASLAVGLSKGISLLPVNKVKSFHGTVKKWLAEDVYDTERFERAYGFKTKIGIEEGLKREVEWYRRKR